MRYFFESSSNTRNEYNTMYISTKTKYILNTYFVRSIHL